MKDSDKKEIWIYDQCQDRIESYRRYINGYNFVPFASTDELLILQGKHVCCQI